MGELKAAIFEGRNPAGGAPWRESEVAGVKTAVSLENLEMSEGKGIIFPLQFMGNVIPSSGPRGSNSWRPWLMLVNTIRMMQACQRSRDQTQGYSEKCLSRARNGVLGDENSSDRPSLTARLLGGVYKTSLFLVRH
jgi:hypothetical protein